MGKHFLVVASFFILIVLSFKSVEAKSKPCGFLISSLVTFSGLALNSEIQASVWNSRLPYQIFSNGPERIQITNDANLKAEVNLLHQRYQNRVWDDRPQSYFEPEGLWRADDFRPDNIGPIWLQADGSWNSLRIAGKFEAPLGHFMGIETIYDATPHTPGLYQFSVINYAGYPFYATVTHYAWLLRPERINHLGLEGTLNQDHGNFSVPTPGTIALTAVAMTQFFGRRRNR